MYAIRIPQNNTMTQKRRLVAKYKRIIPPFANPHLFSKYKVIERGKEENSKCAQPTNRRVANVTSQSQLYSHFIAFVIAVHGIYEVAKAI